MGDPYYPWYPGDYLRDTPDLSMLEDGAYRRLLDHYFVSDGNMPADRTRLYRICRAFTQDEQKAVILIVERFFKEENGRIYNHRAEIELQKRRKFIENQQIKSKLGVEARQTKQQPGGQPVGQPGGQPLPSPSSSSSSSKEKTLELFAQFWQAYPRKKSKGQAEKAWAKLKPDQTLLQTMLTSIQKAKQSPDWQKNNGQYIPYPATWLAAKGWEDDNPTTQEGDNTKWQTP
jgi:uncharacterized protein YdaU (DUF1376 family)